MLEPLAPKKQKTVIPAIKLATIICAIQASLPFFAVILMYFGFQGEVVGALIMTYFFTAYPTELLVWTGLPFKGGGFNFPSGFGFFVGLAMWFFLYIILATMFNMYMRRRLEKLST